jgi:tetratricopeptide (TPR) repeat protein/tRNA A-37 threonylcarbamoyl transferase component Bud32
MADGESSRNERGDGWVDALRTAFGPDPEDEAGSEVGVAERIGRLTGEAPPSILLVESSDDEAPVVVAPPPGTAPEAAGNARYQVLGEIARGGVGIVCRARDRDLCRDVAIKVLRGEHGGNPDLLERFIEEAQVEGQLQHPGVIPVYGLEAASDGRPFFAMKLVKGKTLAALLAARPDPSAERRRFLGVFEQVGQTMAYAHARGVVHRDLKPANVMIGAFGEVYVVDWGFAKVRGREDRVCRSVVRPDVSVIATVRTEEEGSHSVAGSVMGTPAYMPPEQALGHIEELDERSDVFSLGAILTEILTGKPPYVGEGYEVLAMAGQAKLDDALGRLDACGADAGLLTLAKDCLKPLRTERPRDAGAVAAATSAWLAAAGERARKAEVSAAEARAAAEEGKAKLAKARLRAEKEKALAAEARIRAEEEAERQKRERMRVLWERKARGLVRLIAVGAVSAVVIGAAALVLTSRWEDRREAVARAAREEALLRATQAEGGGDLSAALAAAREAVARTKDLGGDAGARARAILDRLEARRAAEEAALAEAARDRRMLARLGEAWERLWRDRRQWRPFVDECLGAFREYGADPLRSGPESAERIRGRPAPVADALVAALQMCYVKLHFLEAGGARAKSLFTTLKAADPDPFRNEMREAYDRGDPARLLALARRADPANLPAQSVVLLRNVLFEVWFHAGTKLRLEARTLAPALLRPAWRRNPRDAEVVHGLEFFDRPADDPEAHLPWVEVRLALAPESWFVRLDAAAELHFLDEDAAHALYAEAEAAKIEEFHVWQHRMGDLVVRKYQGLTSATRDEYSGVLLAVAREAVRRFPEDAAAHEWLAWALQGAEKYREAAEVYEATAPLCDNPNRRVGQFINATSSLMWANDIEGAEKAARRALDLLPDHAGALWQMGRVLLARGEAAEAAAMYRRALGQIPEDVDSSLSKAYMADNLEDSEEALALYRRVLRRNPFYFGAAFGCASSLLALGRIDAALELFERIREWRPEEAMLHVSLGCALEAAGDPEGSRAAEEKVVALAPEHPLGHANLAVSGLATGRLRDAHERFVEALRLDGECRAWNRLPRYYRELCEAWAAEVERCLGLEADLPALLDGSRPPGSAGEALTFARLCLWKGHPSAAVALFEAAFAADQALAAGVALVDAARAAVAAAEPGGSGDPPTFRARALEWLRLHHAALAGAFEGAELKVRVELRGQLHALCFGFAPVHYAPRLAALPEAEREAWTAFWEEVRETVRRTAKEDRP